ncbi:hypothetical protein WICPIJ_009608 [Wickerhamomyces pijperi]|uniref:Uncharacterized protein n=1 Tax=Wickerhamomyces pijperi TaxID=599730 RepID=A0A9P8PLM4_WICPI|nr:hypothetical protein WICPIJ_009608 [Wickerhamomyces pijperi]
MKFTQILTGLTSAAYVVGSTTDLIPVETTVPTPTFDQFTTVFVSADSPELEKRYQKVRKPKSETSEEVEETPKPWIRTIYGSIREIVTPTVIDSVTFNQKPQTNTDYPQPWVSLNKDGSPKTIRPNIKNGVTRNPSPTYGTYFQTATTVVYNYEDLQAHNMDPDQVHEEVEYIDEDKTYVSLNPIIRCTPDRYFMKNLARDESSAPWCTPHDRTELRMGKVYFLTWFTKFFADDVKKVKLHFSYVKEDYRTKGMKKRSLEDEVFFSTGWLDNVNGLYPFEIQEDWLLGEFYQNIGVSIQPEDVADEDFELLSNSVVFKIMRRAKVYKKTKEEKAIEDSGITDDRVYYIILSIPSVVAVFAVCTYFFLYLNKNNRDFSDIKRKALKHKILGRFSGQKNKKYNELPQFDKSDKLH